MELKPLAAPALLACLCAAPHAGAATTGALDRLAVSLEARGEAARADFAALALDEVIHAYERELDQLSAPGQVSRRELAKQARWARALEAFLGDLRAAREALDAGAAVELLVGPPAPVQLLVGEHLVPVSSPRIERLDALDRDIVRIYCAAFLCEEGILEPEPVQPASAGGWSFREGMGSTFETGDGLGFMFRSVRERPRKERACRDVHAELSRLADALAARLRAGRAVDFEILRLVSARSGGGERVVVARSGESLRLSLPVLGRVPAVVPVARRWLRARASGTEHHQLVPRADLLLAGLLERP